MADDINDAASGTVQQIPPWLWLILAMLLDGRTPDAIFRRLRTDNAILPEYPDNTISTAHQRRVREGGIRYIIASIQQNIPIMPPKPEGPEELEETTNSFITDVIYWCLSNDEEGLAWMARAKEFDKLDGNNARLKAEGLRRYRAGVDIKTELGYTRNDLLYGDIGFPALHKIWKKVLLRWMTTGILSPENFDD